MRFLLAPVRNPRLLVYLGIGLFVFAALFHRFVQTVQENVRQLYPAVYEGPGNLRVSQLTPGMAGRVVTVRGHVVEERTWQNGVRFLTVADSTGEVTVPLWRSQKHAQRPFREDVSYDFTGTLQLDRAGFLLVPAAAGGITEVAHAAPPRAPARRAEPSRGPSAPPAPVTAEPAPQAPRPRTFLRRPGFYTIVVASVPQQETARALAARFRQQGYSAGVLRTRVQGRARYRVAVGSFADQQSAARALGTQRRTVPDAWLLQM